MAQKRLAKFRRVVIRPMNKTDFRTVLDVERAVYRKKDLQGPSLITHIKQKNGLEYSRIAGGKSKIGTSARTIGYLVAIDDKMDDGRKCVYLDDIALIPQAQRQGIGWRLVRSLVEYLHAKAKKTHRIILFDMHLMHSSQRFMDKHAAQLAKLGTYIAEEEQYPAYYEKGKDALYRVYCVNSQ